jgi:hypothetical protein
MCPPVAKLTDDVPTVKRSAELKPSPSGILLVRVVRAFHTIMCALCAFITHTGLKGQISVSPSDPPSATGDAAPRAAAPPED